MMYMYVCTLVCAHFLYMSAEVHIYMCTYVGIYTFRRMPIPSTHILSKGRVARVQRSQSWASCKNGSASPGSLTVG